LSKQGPDFVLTDW